MPLIKPKARLKVDKKALERLRDKLKGAKQAFVSVGIFEDSGNYSVAGSPSVVEVALWNEFGTGKTPERSFLRSTLDAQRALINTWRGEAIQKMLTQDWSVKQALEMLGFRVSELVKNTIKSNVPPPNAEYTVEKKRQAGVAPRTLIDTGLLLRSVSYRISERV